ncbi:isoprenylcysteine carboxylmethyltransferase family protein [Trinickia terrae]|uniref:Isoprenylcysteine carboxylmethyltransferase family protein n=1 Tax=Trinickia terrae TaxID=2571161 RepID=A0A4U1IFN9_9BURK|nr:isoprenylcysteine carboxylmethyltransferase family protein [Trinickia terrae]TKC92553.1 isoprenylcysteine carboxylmethyltransferase family protein [Trinickia terrae]
MIARLIISTLGWMVFMGACLFGAAGTFDWPAGWTFLVEMGLLSIGSGAWLARHDPELLAERLSVFVQRGQSRWDQVFMICAAVAWVAWLVLMGLDAMRFHGSVAPSWLQGLGGALLALSILFVCFVFRENSYASPVVKIQSERGHKVIDTGPYAYVRHPMYSGAIVYLVGMALLLGSWWGLACVPLITAGLGYRAVREEGLLAERLAGYDAYMLRVRYRLVPYVW